MENVCPRYNKDLIRLYNSLNAKEERLTFPKIVQTRPFIYDRNKNYAHARFEDINLPPINPSEMHAEYQIPQLNLVTRKQGKRKAMLEKFFWNAMSQEVIAGMMDTQEELNYCTEYLQNYYKEGYLVEEKKDTFEENDSHLKYPLYGTGSNAITIYSHTLRTPNQKNFLQPMKRSSDFTKLLSERLDKGWVL